MSTATTLPTADSPTTSAMSAAELITVIPSLRSEVISSGNVTELEKLNILSGHSDQASTVVFTPDGKLLASVSVDGEIKLWDVESGQEINTVEHGGQVVGHRKRTVSSNIQLWAIQVLQSELVGKKRRGTKASYLTKRV